MQARSQRAAAEGTFWATLFALFHAVCVASGPAFGVTNTRALAVHVRLVALIWCQAAYHLPTYAEA